MATSSRTLILQGMHCQKCVEKITGALSHLPGVTDARVTLSPPRAFVETSGEVPLAVFANAVASVGAYSATEAPLGATLVIQTPTQTDVKPASLYPLVLIVAYIAGVVGAGGLTRGTWRWPAVMNDFMAGFFLVFSFFKLLDLQGFADAYQGYDVLARRVRAWAFAYPFVELALGVSYLCRFQPAATNGVTLGLMVVGSIGVLRALLRKDAIRCACLGTALNLPMTTVTLVEDLGMAAMAAAALLWGH